MGSVACSQCGRVRWDPAVRCPACGAESSEILGPSTGLAQASPGPKRKKYLDVSWREVRTGVQKNLPAPRPGLRLAAELGGMALVVVVIAVLLVYFFSSSPGRPEVLIPQGTTIVVPQGGGWVIETGGTLQGSFSVGNGTAEVCFANYDMFGYAVSHRANFSQCPSNATYSSGFVSSGILSGTFGPGSIYFQTFTSPAWSSGQPRPTVTWTGQVEIVPS